MQKCRYDVKEVLKFTLPMILTSLSMSLMFNVDRMVLARYSLDSMNAAALAGNFVAMVSFIVICIAQVATVFVGQYNGLGEYRKTGRAPWQMVYLGLISFLIFVPIAVFCRHFNLFPAYYEKEGVEYLQILTAFSGLSAICSALSAFFIGRGQSLIIVFIVLLVNVVNFFADIFLVFGVDNVIEPLGAKGAAIATVVSETVRGAVLLVVFLNRENREKFGTSDNKFRKKIFFDCIKVGFPLSCGKVLSLLGWFILLEIYNLVSKDLATLEGFAISMWIIFMFFAEGGGRAISSMSANLIGENNLPEIKKLLRLFLVANFILCMIFAIPLVFCHDIIFWFLDGVNGDISHLRPEFRFLFVTLWVVIFADGVYYIIGGVLNAGGDTKFPTCLELITLWAGVVVPTIIIYLTGNLTSIRITYTLIPITGIINASVAYRRYKQMKWFNKLV
jgi:MATE family multidrug resistance protein